MVVGIGVVGEGILVRVRVRVRFTVLCKGLALAGFAWVCEWAWLL